jgi:hypothetical protein
MAVTKYYRLKKSGKISSGLSRRKVLNNSKNKEGKLATA